jgi:putative pyruvate formate lyase activating enzyme
MYTAFHDTVRGLAMAVNSFEDLTRDGCRLCPRSCGVDRGREPGFCLAGPLPSISQAGPHHGEEPVLSGWKGSGTLFLSGCNLHCIFCQNYDISSCITGKEMTAEEVASTALILERRGCHNINFVTPTHHVDVLAEAIRIARQSGLEKPVVYNCGGYESPDALRLLHGLVEIYMPDVKFFSATACKKYLDAPDYGDVVKEALKIMQAQVGDLRSTEDGIATQGLLIRHLVMPGYTEDSYDILQFIQREVSARAYINVMGQYWPTSGVRDHPEIDREPHFDEIALVKKRAMELGLIVCR